MSNGVLPWYSCLIIRTNHLLCCIICQLNAYRDMSFQNLRDTSYIISLQDLRDVSYIISLWDLRNTSVQDLRETSVQNLRETSVQNLRNLIPDRYLSTASQGMNAQNVKNVSHYKISEIYNYRIA